MNGKAQLCGLLLFRDVFLLWERPNLLGVSEGAIMQGRPWLHERSEVQFVPAVGSWK
jgi:hypothetical protein